MKPTAIWFRMPKSGLSRSNSTGRTCRFGYGLNGAGQFIIFTIPGNKTQKRGVRRKRNVTECYGLYLLLCIPGRPPGLFSDGRRTAGVPGISCSGVGILPHRQSGKYPGHFPGRWRQCDPGAGKPLLPFRSVDGRDGLFRVAGRG